MVVKSSRLGRLSMEDEWKVEGLRLNWCSLSSCLSLALAWLYLLGRHPQPIIVALSSQ
jgi:hypothetical protein